MEQPGVKPPTEHRRAPCDRPDDAPSGAARRTVVCISSEQLFAGASEVQIEHRGAVYRLQRTSLGKLILTK
ncbi:hemin uptake protein HemP [Piscinibacter sp. XHJ-5]|uniref:hemin uptake protein HemP n=1 Tax=Piscinibacter sp. XHJ-5 TaxID=3037797 RepID=UPI002452F733|nr:hemin uptake protein HemP [Piscinibacter sp. XHJ-5]